MKWEAILLGFLGFQIQEQPKADASFVEANPEGRTSISQLFKVPALEVYLRCEFTPEITPTIAQMESAVGSPTLREPACRDSISLIETIGGLSTKPESPFSGTRVLINVDFLLTIDPD